MTVPHVFVVPGDVRRLACDAWLLPTDRALSLTSAWATWRPQVARLGERAQALREERAYALALPGEDPVAPVPVLTAVPYDGVRRGEDVRDRVAAGLRAAAEAAPDSRAERPLPLLALPAFGTAGGMGDDVRGDVLGTLLEVAEVSARELGVDVALVLRPPDLGHVQRLRRSTPARWSSLGDHVQRARVLAERARDQVLVPFLGAGVSASAGVPLWGDLLEELGARVPLPAAEQAAFDDLNVLDKAHVLRTLYAEQGQDFPRAVAALTSPQRYGLAPVQVAALQAREAVTLNYDELYEKASEDLGDPVAALPDDPVRLGERWLLKLHGSVKDPRSIVLTREDYLAYGTGRHTLAALAKALLLTRHLLFVGFGLEDDHFHELVHDVRQVLPPREERRRLGTALVLGPQPLQKRIWKDDLELLELPGADIAEQARMLEVFLDCLLAHADPSEQRLLDPRYAHGSGDAERALAARLRHLADASPAERALPAWRPVQQALDALGG